MEGFNFKQFFESLDKMIIKPGTKWCDIDDDDDDDDNIIKPIKKEEIQEEPDSGWITIPKKKGKRRRRKSKSQTYINIQANIQIFVQKDEIKQCIDCHNIFTITPEEQEYLDSMGYKPKKRCRECSEKNKLKRSN